MSKLSPALLRIAREGAGLTQTDLASQAGVQQAEISRWERGLREPNEDQQSRLSDAVGVTPSFLQLDVPIARPLHRTARIESKRAERATDARIELARIAASTIMEDIHIEAPFAFPTFDDPISTEPEAAAEAVRRVWRIPEGPIGNLSDYLESAGAIVLRVDFGSASILAAYSHPRGDHRWCFLNNRASDPARTRFSLAHEIGHAMLHWDRFDQPTQNEAEREAHRFAAALLMPRDEILRSLGTTRIRPDDLIAERERWGVSIQALVMRASDLGLISKDQKSRLFRQISARRWRQSEPGEVIPERPQLFQEAMAIHREEHGYHERDFASITKLPAEKLGELMPDYFQTETPRKPSLRVVR